MQQPLIDRLANGPAAQNGRGVTVAWPVDAVHVEPAGDSIEHRLIVGLNQNDDVCLLSEQHLRQGVGSSFAAVENVVTDEAH
jgi:hypothetical protein